MLILVSRALLGEDRQTGGGGGLPPPDEGILMKKLVSVVCGLGLVAGVGLASPALAANTQDAAEGYTYDLLTFETDDPRAEAVFAELDQIMPDWRERLAARQLDDPGEVALLAALNRAINPGDYECGPTPLDAYVEEITQDVDFLTILILALLGVLDMPSYDALLFGTEGDPDYALPGDAKGLTKAFTKAQRFWDVESDDIQLIGMHGEMVTDQERVERYYEVLDGLSEEEAAEMADLVVELVAQDPALDGGDHPLFTLNAFAFSAEGESDPLIGSIPDKIVMGEGIVEANDWMGLGSVGSQAVLSHEFAHHVQYEEGLFDADLPPNEATRRTELMADAYASYFSAHRKGLNLRKDVILTVQESFYAVGDCSFSSGGHHGTPNQRLRAAEWGADLAISARKQGHVLSLDELLARFEAQLPIIVAPDA